MKQYSTEYHQVRDDDDPRGYHWEAVRRIEVTYDKTKKRYKVKKGAKWERVESK